jgi:phosphatidate cytidylyltransferase
VDGRYRVLSVLSALASLSGAGFSLVWLHQQEHGAFLILVLLFTIWAADIGAYFVGRAFGRTRLAPQISPGKTREGLLGGVMLALLVAYLTAQIAGVLPRQVGLFVLLTAVTAVSAAGGDLFISLHKRAVGVKDSGKLLPGHGGVLDRFDSLLAGAPFFALGSLLLAGQ